MLSCCSVVVGVPRHLNVDRIKEELMKIEDVYLVETLNIWSLTAGKTTAIVHLQLGRIPHEQHTSCNLLFKLFILSYLCSHTCLHQAL